jgi:hypothetical protein
MKNACGVAGNDDSGTFDLDNLDACFADFDFGDDGHEETEDGGEEVEVDAADSIGKALLVKQACLHHVFLHVMSFIHIRGSPQARAFSKKSCEQVEVPIL